MKQPQKLTNQIWQSLQHCYKTRLQRYEKIFTGGLPVSLIVDETAGTAYMDASNGEIKLGFGSKLCAANTKQGSQIEFYKRVLFHEFGHAVETVGMAQLHGDGDYETGRQKMMQDLSDNGIPFKMYNLFEDVRLEGLQRRAKYGLSRFGWNKWQTSCVPDDHFSSDRPNAGQILYEIKMQENGRAPMKALLSWCKSRRQSSVFHNVRRKFFNQLVALKTDIDAWPKLLALMIEWKAKYGTVTSFPDGPTGSDIGEQGDVPKGKGWREEPPKLPPFGRGPFPDGEGDPEAPKKDRERKEQERAGDEHERNKDKDEQHFRDQLGYGLIIKVNGKPLK